MAGGAHDGKVSEVEGYSTVEELKNPIFSFSKRKGKERRKERRKKKEKKHTKKKKEDIEEEENTRKIK